MLSGIFGLMGGIGMPMQTSVNARLGRKMGSPFTAAFINFLVGTAALLILTVIVERGLQIPFGEIAEAPPWILLGGAFAVVFITGNILLIPRVGSVQTAILPALGQIIMGTLTDSFGWFGQDIRPLSVWRLMGVVLVITGVITVILAKNANQVKTDNHQVKAVWLWRLFGIIVGMCMASQTAVNSHLGVVAGSRFYAALINFCVGLIILFILYLILGRGKQTKDKGVYRPWWMWIGGLFGVLFVVGNIITAQALGTGMAVIILLTGLMIGGLLVDQFGLFESKQRPVTWKEILGVVIMVGGAALFHLM